MRGLRVEARGGLVEQQQFRVGEHGPSQGQPCLHAGGVAAHTQVEGVVDPEAGGAGLDGSLRTETPQVGGVAQVVAA